MIMTKRQKFTVGLDWLISEDGRPFLLEFNMPMESEGNDSLYLRPFHFFQVSLDKILQYNLLGEFMPDSILDKQEFDEFVRRRGEVVYKKGSGSQGSGVSVLQKPEWEPDLVQEFIPPRVHTVGSKHYPYVIRDYHTIIASKKDFSWSRDNVFRKQSEVAIEDSEDNNRVFRLNTFNGASRCDADEVEMKLTLEKTNEVMNIIREQGKKCNWDPTRLYDSAIVGYYMGYRVAMFGCYPEYFPQLARSLQDNSIRFTPFGITNGLSRAINAAEFGADIVVLTNYHSIKWDDMQRTRYRIERSQDGEINHAYSYDGSVFEKFSPKSNVIIDGEFDPSQITVMMQENYQKR